MEYAPSVLSIETPSQRRSTGECPTPATETLPRCSHTPSPSLSRRHGYRSGAVMAPPFLYALAVKVWQGRTRRLAKNWDEGLHSGLASFETRPLGAPQDEDKALMGLRKFLILRRPRKRPSRRTHGTDPANHGILARL